MVEPAAESDGLSVRTGAPVCATAGLAIASTVSVAAATSIVRIMGRTPLTRIGRGEACLGSTSQYRRYNFARDASDSVNLVALVRAPIDCRTRPWFLDPVEIIRCRVLDLRSCRSDRAGCARLAVAGVA